MRDMCCVSSHDVVDDWWQQTYLETALQLASSDCCRVLMVLPKLVAESFRIGDLSKEKERVSQFPATRIGFWNELREPRRVAHSSLQMWANPPR